MKFQPNPQEAVPFEGDGTLLLSKPNAKETEVVVTKERPLVALDILAVFA